MRRLYFHIGPHKTGSTSIQHALAQSKDLRVFNELRNEHSAKKYNEWYGNDWVRQIKGEPLSRRVDFVAEFPERLGAFNPEGDVIFSAEDVSWVLEPAYLERFAKALDPYFDEIKIIVYLRRQDRSAVSFLQQATKTGMRLFFQFLSNHHSALPELNPDLEMLFDYHTRFGHWADAFGEDAMIFRVFGDVVRGGGLLKSFGDIVGLDLGETDVKRRVSIPKSAQILNQIVLDMDLRDFDPTDLMRLTADGEKMMPPRAKAEAFYAQFRDGNRALNERFGVNSRDALFDDDFSKYSHAGNETLDAEATDQIVRALILAMMNAEARRKVSERRRMMLRKKLRRWEGEEKALAQKANSE